MLNLVFGLKNTVKFILLFEFRKQKIYLEFRVLFKILLSSLLKQKKIFLTKNNKLAYISDLYIFDEYNKELRIENFLNEDMILNQSYALIESKDKIQNVIYENWLNFLIDLGLKTRPIKSIYNNINIWCSFLFVFDERLSPF